MKQILLPNRIINITSAARRDYAEPQFMPFRRILTTMVLAALACRLSAMASDGSDSTRLRINAERIDHDIPLTGRLDDPAWRTADSAEIRYEVTPAENTPATQRSTVRILYNTNYLYFGFDCRDTHPSEIRAHVTDRDKMFDDDWVMAIFDTYGDYQRSYELVVNPYGIQGDLLRTSNNEDESFDALWESAAAINDSGWTAVMAVPFKSLRFPSRPDQRWVGEFIRNYPRASRVQNSWVRIDRNNPCLPCQGGIIEGIRDVQSSTSVDLLPYAVGQESGSLRDDSDPMTPFQSGKVTGRIGVGLRYAPTPDLAMEGTINPDFSQVESDATQISVNSNFALFYPEKRPFFLLGADMFQNNTQTFYSRTINNPLGAARVIGKSGSLSFAYLTASDRNTPFIIPGEETSDAVATDLKSLSNIVRARYDFGKENFIGGMVTTRNTSAAHNYLGGIDWNYKFWENYYFGGEVFYSDTKEVDDTALFSDRRGFGSTGHDAAFNGEQYAGSSAQITFRRNARNYSFGLQVLDRTSTFQAQDGFVPENNTRIAILQQQYAFYPNNALLDQWSIQLNSALHYNEDWIRKEKWALPSVDFQLKGQTEINITYFAVNDELYKGVQFDGIHRGEVSIYSRPSSLLTLSVDGTFGRFIKRNDAPEMGHGHNINTTAQIRATPQLEIDLSYSRARLSSVSTGELFYDGYIARATGILQFTREVFLRMIGQYDGFEKRLDIYPLLSYKLNPYTIFYAGSTYTLADFGETFGFTKTARQYFVKLQYLFRS